MLLIIFILNAILATIVVNQLTEPLLYLVPLGTVLGPLLFSLHINDITSDVDSEIRLLADDCLLS